MNCIVVDDEPYAVAILKDYIEKTPSLNLVATFSDGLQALFYLRENKVDLIFLDIQMPELTGMQLLKVLTNKPQVILTTAYDNYAVEGFNLDVTDYLLKPIPFERFYVAVEKAEARRKEPISRTIETPAASKEEDTEMDFIFLRVENKIQKVNLNDILYIEGMKDYLKVITESERIMTLLSFVKLSEMLPAKEFIRVHKSYVVPLRKVESIERNHIKIRDKFVPIGDAYRAAFYNILQSKKLL